MGGKISFSDYLTTLTSRHGYTRKKIGKLFHGNLDIAVIFQELFSELKSVKNCAQNIDTKMTLFWLFILKKNKGKCKKIDSVSKKFSESLEMNFWVLYMFNSDYRMVNLAKSILEEKIWK